jgi:hypothetical protein
MPRYTPDTTVIDRQDIGPQELARYIKKELDAIAAALGVVSDGYKEVITATGVRPREGQLVYADGIGWNPGDGKGLYLYDSAVWRRIIQSNSAIFDSPIRLRDGGVANFPAGVASELNAAMLDFGVNEDTGARFGPPAYTSANQGGFFRVDTRGGTVPLFNWYARLAGSTAGVSLFAFLDVGQNSGQTLFSMTHTSSNAGIALTGFGGHQYQINSLTDGRLQIRDTTIASTRIIIGATGLVGVTETQPQTKLHVGTKVADDNGYTYDADALMAVHQTPTATATLNDPKEVLLLARQGTSGQAYGAGVSFRLSRWENNGTNSRTRLDIILAQGAFLTATTTVLKLFSDGRIAGTGLHNTGTVTGTADQFIASGSRTGAITGIVNMASSTNRNQIWTRVGNVVTCAGAATVAATVANNDVTFEIDLPIASTFADGFSGSGTATYQTGAAAAFADGTVLSSATGKMQITIHPPNTNSVIVRYNFEYEVL